MRTAETTVDQLEQLLASDEAHIARLRARQLATLHALDQAQVAMVDGARTLAEWVAARLDLAPETARTLVRTARSLVDQPNLQHELQDGVVSFDRAAAETRLIVTGADPELVARSRGWDLAGLRRITAHHQRITRTDEQQAFGERFLALQPTLDEASYKLWGQLPGTDGRLVEQPSPTGRTSFPRCPTGDTVRGPNATPTPWCRSPKTPSPAPLVSIFVDSQLAAATNGEAGASVDVGPRVGPLTLEEILCNGHVEILMTGADGTPSPWDRPPRLFLPSCAASSSTATAGSAPPTGANPPTGSNPTTSPPAAKAAPTNQPTSPHCVVVHLSSVDTCRPTRSEER